ncbi:MAG: hypothetical protein HDT27_04865 [Subdoligranulum sp.]|nr:hypothetical protein [Subdoligranulum sp.]
MESFAAWLTDMFLRHGIVTQEQTAWCQYMLLKKLLSFTICFLMVLLGTLISGFWPALLFAGGLGFLAKRTNGYHAHTPLGCAAVSVLFEAVAMWILPRFALEPYLILLVGAPVCVLGLAPVNNKQIHLSEKELGSIAWRARLRLFAVAAISAALCAGGHFSLAVSLALAIFAVALSLMLATVGLGVQ